MNKIMVDAGIDLHRKKKKKRKRNEKEKTRNGVFLEMSHRQTIQHFLRKQTFHLTR